MKKIICILVCILFLSIAVIVPAASVKTISENEEDDIKYLEIGVFREEDEELIPVHRAEVRVFAYPKVVPQYALTYTDGYLPFQPLVRVGDDVKINAYHEWFGGETILHHVGEEDPEIIHFDIVLDPSKSVSKDRFELNIFSFLMQKLLVLHNLLRFM